MVADLKISVDDALAAALEGVILKPDDIALEPLLRHAVLEISHDLGDMAEGADELLVARLFEIATRLENVASAVSVLGLDNHEQEGGA